MTTNTLLYGKVQLARILSALTGETRSPKSRSRAVQLIAEWADETGVEFHRVFDHVNALFNGELTDEEFRAAVQTPQAETVEVDQETAQAALDRVWTERSEAQAEQPATEEAAAEPKESKKGTLVAMLSSSEGASVDEMAVALGWTNRHTVHATMAGLRKHGTRILVNKIEGRGRVYHIEA